jgi:hypothetical protein
MEAKWLERDEWDDVRDAGRKKRIQRWMTFRKPFERWTRSVTE